MKILLVEDNEAIRGMLQVRLEMVDHEILQAENGRLGVEVALAEQPDIVLMDMHMPVLNGYEAARELRARGYTGVVVAVTASALTHETNKALAAGCDGFISKPVGPDFEEQVEQLWMEKVNNRGGPGT